MIILGIWNNLFMTIISILVLIGIIKLIKKYPFYNYKIEYISGLIVSCYFMAHVRGNEPNFIV